MMEMRVSHGRDNVEERLAVKGEEEEEGHIIAIFFS